MTVTYRCLSQEDVIAAGGLDMDACLEVIRNALALQHAGETIAPKKAVIHWSDDLDTDEKLGRIMAMPAFVGGDVQVTGMKWIPSVPSNPTRGLPRGIGLVLLSDPENGLPLAFMDGTVVSAMRTGAVSGIAAGELARAGAAVLGLLGAGVQARTQLLALERTLPGLEEIRIYDPDREKAERLAGSPTDGPSRNVVGSAEEAVRGCDVVVPVTMAPEPFIPAEWLEPGSVAISVSSLDFDIDTVPTADLLVADDVEHELAHPPRLFARADAAGFLDRDAVVSLGAILAGAHPGRSTDDEVVMVSPIGLAIEDVAWAAHVFRRAEEIGLGAEQKLWDEPVWR